MRLIAGRRSRPFVILLLVAAAGCAPAPIKIDRGELARLKDEPELHAVRVGSPSLDVKTRAGDAVGQLGLLGLAVQASVYDTMGARIMKEHALVDPVARVQERFLAAVTRELGLSAVRVTAEPVPSDEPAVLRAKLGRGLVFDFKTLAWLLWYDPNRWSGYHVGYAVRGRLVRLDGGTVIWQGACDPPFDRSQPGPTMEQLVANGAELLKTRFAEAADRCAVELVNQLLGREKS